MANRRTLLCFYCVLLIATTVDGKSYGRSRSSGRLRGSGSHRSGGYSHSTSYSRPSSHSYPSSSSGFSGSGRHTSSSSNYGFSVPVFASTGVSGVSHNTPSRGHDFSSSAGSKAWPSLSGAGSSTFYPSSNSGLSGNGNKPPSVISSRNGPATVTKPLSETYVSANKISTSYPSSKSGLSGSSAFENKLSPSYPSSNSGLSGNGNKLTLGTSKLNPPITVTKPHSGSYDSDKQSVGYPTSNSGLSGSYNKLASSGSIAVLENKQSPSYPSSNSGLSGFLDKPLPSSSSGNNYPNLSSVNKPPPSYPSSISGLSGSYNKPLLASTANSYPSAPSGLSGNNKPISPSTVRSDTISVTSLGSGQRPKLSVPIPLPITPSISDSSVSYPPKRLPAPLPVTHNSSSHGYPTQSHGLSGSGSHSNTSLSGSNPSTVPKSNISFPPQVNLGRTQSGKPNSGSYPITTGSVHSYPSTSTGLSGSGHHKPSIIATTGHYPPQFSPTGHIYPSSSTGLSGAGTRNVYPQTIPPQNTYGSASKVPHYHDNKYPSNYGSVHYLPTYYTSPQYVYITEYRNSGSRYSDLLSGLALYNLGRSHSHHHIHNYYDDYYIRRYGANSNYKPENRPTDTALCMLKIKENDSVQFLKIPCEIVSTFTDGAVKHNVTTNTVCVTNITTVLNNTVAGNVTSGANMTTVNATTCTTNTTDPLSVKGPKTNTSNMQCSVEIKTRDSYFNNNVDCNILMQHSQMPEPKKTEHTMMPSREKLKSWLEKPPWWMSVLIAA